MKCPNINSAEWKTLVNKIGVFEAFREYRNNNFEIPNANSYEETFKGVNATMKIVDALQRLQRKSYPSNNVQGFYNDLVKLGAPKNQIDLLKSHIESKSIAEISVPDLIISLLSEMSYTVQINTAKQQLPIDDQTRYYQDGNKYYSEDPYDGKQEITFEEYERYRPKLTSNSSYYSNLTVPGGTNYTENEIAIPGVEIQEKPQGVPAKEGVQELFDSNFAIFAESKTSDEVINKLLANKVIDKKCS